MFGCIKDGQRFEPPRGLGVALLLDRRPASPCLAFEEKRRRRRRPRRPRPLPQAPLSTFRSNTKQASSPILIQTLVWLNRAANRPERSTLSGNSLAHSYIWEVGLSYWHSTCKSRRTRPAGEDAVHRAHSVVEAIHVWVKDIIAASVLLDQLSSRACATITGESPIFLYG